MTGYSRISKEIVNTPFKGKIFKFCDYLKNVGVFKECFNGSVLIDDLCIFISEQRVKASWANLNQWTMNLSRISMLKINSPKSFLKIQDLVLKIYRQEQIEDQLVFNIGFSYSVLNGKLIQNYLIFLKKLMFFFFILIVQILGNGSTVAWCPRIILITSGIG